MGPALSPDARRLAYAARSPETQKASLWLTDFSTGTTTQLTFPPVVASKPVWSPDGRELAYRSSKNGGGVYVRTIEGLGSERQILKDEDSPGAVPCDWPADGRYILYRDARAQRVRALPLSGETIR